MITLAVDCMGAITAPRHARGVPPVPRNPFPGAFAAGGLASKPSIVRHDRATIVAASEVVAMDDPGGVALRKKKDSSMRVAIQQVRMALPPPRCRLQATRAL